MLLAGEDLACSPLPAKPMRPSLHSREFHRAWALGPSLRSPICASGEDMGEAASDLLSIYLCHILGFPFGFSWGWGVGSLQKLICRWFCFSDWFINTQTFILINRHKRQKKKSMYFIKRQKNKNVCISSKDKRQKIKMYVFHKCVFTLRNVLLFYHFYWLPFHPFVWYFVIFFFLSF